nr:MAG TPA: hypothetical protein [Caudoviricetes sp.]DAG57163.1 MAG TPA: hypothetical protein [Caudoviricetes sp.]
MGWSCMLGANTVCVGASLNVAGLRLIVYR